MLVGHHRFARLLNCSSNASLKTDNREQKDLQDTKEERGIQAARGLQVRTARVLPFPMDMQVRVVPQEGMGRLVGMGAWAGQEAPAALLCGPSLLEALIAIFSALREEVAVMVATVAPGAAEAPAAGVAMAAEG